MPPIRVSSPPGAGGRHGVTTLSLGTWQWSRSRAPSRDVRFTRPPGPGFYTRAAGGPVGAPSRDGWTPTPGADYGPLTLQHVIGRGGFGEVWEALDRRSGEAVAAKLLHHPTPRATIALKRELRHLSQLGHPGLVAPYELLHEEGTWCFVMELVAGAPFDAWVAAASDPTERARRLYAGVGRVAEAIDFLHQSGMLHLDLKPSNVLVRPDGRVAVLDFGLARRYQGRVDLGEDVGGTVHYMAPEVEAGRMVGPEADWYALGVMLHWTMFGEYPPTADPAPPGEGSPPADGARNPEGLLALTARLLEPLPARRGGIDAVREALAEVLSVSTPEPVPLPVGRGEELSALGVAWRRALAGRPRAVALLGPSGIGKSHLAERFAEAVRRDTPQVVILGGRCNADEAIPYRGLDEAIDRLAGHLDRGLLGHRIGQTDPDLQGAARIFPVLAGGDRRRAGGPTAADPVEERQSASAALRRLLDRISQTHPILLLIDDVQWAGPDTLALTADLLAGNGRFLVLLAGRDSDVESRAAVESLAAAHVQVDRLLLGPLGAAEARAVLREARGRTVDARTLDRAATAAGGVPFLLREYGAALRHHGDTVPDEAFAHQIGERVHRFGPEARRLLETISLATRPLPARVAADASGVSYRPTLHLLRAAGLVTARRLLPEEPVEPYHAQIREACVAAMTSERRADVHRALAAALDRHDPDPAVLAHHHHGAGDLPKAAEHAVNAAARAEAALAFDLAARLYGDALAWDGAARGDRDALVEAHARCLFAGGRTVDAGRAWAAAAEREPERAVTLTGRAAEAFLLGGELDLGLSALDGFLGRASLPPVRSGLRAMGAVLLHLCLAALSRPGLHRPAEEHDAEILDLYWGAGRGLIPVYPLEGMELMVRGLPAAQRVGDMARAARIEGFVGFLLSQFPPAAGLGRRFEARADASAQELGAAPLHAIHDIWRACGAMARGDWAAMNAAATAALETLDSQCVGLSWERVQALSILAMGANVAGDLRRTVTLARQGLTEAERRGDRYGQALLHQYLAMAAVAEADLPRARSHTAWIAQQWAPGRYTLPHFFAMCLDVLADLYEGRAQSGAARMSAHRAAWRRAGGATIPIWRIEWRIVEARVLLAQPPDRARQRQCARLAQALAREPRSDGPAHARFIAAAAGRGRLEPAELEAAVRAYEQAGMGLYAAATALQAARASGQQRALESCAQRVRSQGVADPIRWADALTPVPWLHPGP